MSVIKSFFRTWWDTLVRLVTRRQVLVPPATYASRLFACRSCPFHAPGALVQCYRCRCAMVVKARLSAAKCPENFWYA